MLSEPWTLPVAVPAGHGPAGGVRPRHRRRAAPTGGRRGGPSGACWSRVRAHGGVARARPLTWPKPYALPAPTVRPAAAVDQSRDHATRGKARCAAPVATRVDTWAESTTSAVSRGSARSTRTPTRHPRSTPTGRPGSSLSTGCCCGVVSTTWTSSATRSSACRRRSTWPPPTTSGGWPRSGRWWRRRACGSMTEPRFRPGARVRATTVDPPHHTRVPRYVRGHLGEVVHVDGPHPLPDDRARHLPEPRVEPVYAVR